jgi:uncharacterized cupin superfamily protein
VANGIVPTAEGIFHCTVVNIKAMIVNETVMIVTGMVRVVQEMELPGRIVSTIK